LLKIKGGLKFLTKISGGHGFLEKIAMGVPYDGFYGFYCIFIHKFFLGPVSSLLTPTVCIFMCVKEDRFWQRSSNSHLFSLCASGRHRWWRPLAVYRVGAAQAAAACSPMNRADSQTLAQLNQSFAFRRLLK
jgi:hypothetical protein